MCVVSNVMDGFEPLIPRPVPRVTPWGPPSQDPIPMPAPPASPWPWGPIPGTGLPIKPEDLRALLDAFYKALEAAKAADKAAGQPDCVDPEKRKLEDRVAELEKRLGELTRKPKKAKRRRA